ncbi:MAG: hypothetical protein COC05_01810 [Gammaproteobacteria bacterium]|nr:MAG: hypothetical protein COC05_01810 [Gammaproteobacteria bacterium]
MAIKRRKPNRKQVGFATRAMRHSSMLMTIAGTALVIALVVTTARWLGDTDNFPITKVNVEGGFQHVSPEDVRAAVMPFIGSGFFQLNVDSIKQTLGEMPWVDAVVVRKVWPDTVYVHIKEQRVLARWGENGLLNRNGESFFPELNTIDDSLSLLVGPKGSEKQVADQYKTSAALLRDIDVKLVSLDYTARGSWQLEFEGGQVVMLGRENIGQRMQRLAGLYRELEKSQSESNIVTVDMRYDTGIAVQWQHQPGAECEKSNVCQQALVAKNNGELIF